VLFYKKLGLIFFLGVYFSSNSLFAQNINAGTGSIVSVKVESIISGKIIESVNEDLLMTPASTLKAASTVMALEILGSNYSFVTELYSRGTVNNGVLKGDLIIKGAGDPTLGSKYFSSTSAQKVISFIHSELNKAGIRQITGDIYIDESLFAANKYPDGRLWEDMANYYGAAPSALTWCDNTFTLVLSSGDEPGSFCNVVETIPALRNIDFTSTVKAVAGNKDSAYIYGYPGLRKWELRGSMPLGRSSFRIKGSLPFPGMHFGYELASGFSNNTYNPEVIVVNKSYDYSKLNKVTEIVSPKVGDIIKVINHRSVNLFADHLFLALTKANFYSWDNSRELFYDFWESRVSMPYIRILDGSGLSPLNLVTTGFMVDVLKYAYLSSNFDVFKSSLAVGGQQGTISGMWKHASDRGRVYAKSGYMKGTLAYCGYIYTPKNDVLVFSIMVNNMTADLNTVRAGIESYVSLLINRY